MSNVLDLLQGNGLINVTDDGQIEPPLLVLSSRGGNKIGVIKNVSSIDVTHPLSEVAELSFDVTKEVNGEVYEDWDKVKDFKLVQIPYDNTWYEATVSIDEEDEIVKHVTCVHANEAELGQLNLYDTEINTENDIARDDYEETFFYDEDNPKVSLLHRILKDKAPHYQIYHVDNSLMKLFRIFSFNGTSIQEALNQIAEEVNCLFVYGEWYENDGKYHRTISAYDLEDYCNECHKRGEYTNHVCTNCGSTDIVEGYGEDTGIFISKENLATSISYESNTDNVKNCFRLVAGDDVMTATVKSCNPSMSQYMWYFSDDMLEDMSTALATKIVDYEKLVESYKNEEEIEIPSSYIETYNTYVDKYGSLNDELVIINLPIKGTAELTEAYYNAMNMYGFLKSEMMPASEKVEDTTAEDQMFLLKSGDFTEIGVPTVSGTIPYTTANSAIQSYAKVFIDTSRYKISVFTDDIDGTTWTGTITIKSYTDDEDSAVDSFELELFDSTSNEKYAEWLEQSVQKVMANREVTDLSVVNLFKKDENIEAFKERLKLYSLDYLNIMSSMATSAITIMSEQGVASSDSLDKDIYTQLYKPYLNKSRAIQKEIEVREAELAMLLQPTNEDGVPDPRYQSLGLLDIITNKQDEIRRTLDLNDYLGDELWEELSFYRRETDYTNQNYISDGLTDSEVIEQAKNFVDIASKEIVKAATLQHSISAPLSNFLLMDEFKKLQEKFKVGNWIHLQVDGKVYKLRLANWEVDYDKIDDLDIEFTDAIRVGDIISDVGSILSKSRSMATTYEYVARQAEKGNTASNTVKFFRDSGITFTKVKAITSNGNTNIVYDDDGILLKRVDGLEELPEQARIYNNGIYITKDAWETVSTGLGHFSYVDPETGTTVETYGIIADTVIGKLILGENLKIYSKSNRFAMGDDGLVITSRDDKDNEDLFTVQKDTGEVDDDGEPIIEKYIYVDKDGNINITGNSIIINGANDSYKLDDARKVASNYLSADSTGIMIADMRYGAHDPSDPEGKNILLTDTAVKIRNGQTDLATYGDTITLGQNSGKNVQIGSNGVTINDGNYQLASYGSDVVIGKTTTPHLEMDSNGISAYRDSTNKYFEVGSGSSNVVETHAISETPLIVNLDYPIATVSSVTVNNIATDEYSYNVGDEFIILNDRPVGSCNVSVQYSYMSYVDDDDEQGTEITATQTLNYGAMPALAITLSDTASTVDKVSVNGTQISNYTFNNNTITLNNRPSTGSEIEIEYTVSKIAPYFTFNERDAVAEKGIGSASFSDNGAASGVSSFITGINGEASGRASFVSGVDSNATGEASSALGKGTIASSSGGLSCGRYNNGGNDYLFAVGNGTDDSNRSNAFAVTENGNTLISNRILNGNGKPLFASQYFSTGNASVQPTKAKQFKVNIAKQGYTPIAISYDQILGTNSSWCSVYRRIISGNYAYFFIRDMSSVLTATVSVGFKIFYISNSAM